MSDITVNVTNAGAANVSVSNGSTVNATVGNGGAVNVAVGTVSPGNATVVAGTLTINSTTTLAPGSSAYVKNVGTAYAASLDIGIPSGNASTVQVGSTTTLDSGNASVTGSTNGSTLTLAFAIPRGAAGTNGTNGTNGITPTFTASASTLSAGSSATVTTTTTNNGANVALAFGIPQGAAGSGGGSNLTLSDATPSALGTAAAGTSSTASRSDHVHAVPTINYANLTNVPSTFVPSTHAHAVSDVSGLQTALDSKQAAGTYATLVGGTVPSSQLPSYVDDVIEYANLAAFTEQSTGKIYVARDTGKIYRWSGSTYIEISPSPGSTDSVTEGSTNLYFTNARAAAAAPVQSVAGRNGAVTLGKADVGLGNVDNTADASKPVSTAQAAANAAVLASAVQRGNHTGTQTASTISDFATESAKYGPVVSVSGRTGAIVLTKSDAGLSNVDNTADANKPVSTDQAAADAAVLASAIQRGNHTGTQTASTISDFATEAAKYGPVVSVSGRTGVITVAQLGTSGAPSSTTFLRGDGAWSTAGLTADDDIDGGWFYGSSGLSRSITITSPPTDQTASSGAATFGVTAIAEPSGTLTYQWQKSDAGGAFAATQRTLPSGTTSWISVAYGNGTFVAVSIGTNIAATSTDGITWTQRTMPASVYWYGVTYGAGTFVAVAYNTSVAATSTDGITWTQRNLPTNAYWYSVTYGNGTFVAVARDSAIAATSADGVTWTQRTLPEAASWSSIAYGSGTFVAMYETSSSSSSAATSADGITWTQRAMPAGAYWSGVAYGAGKFVAVASTSSIAATSTDGVTWTQRSLPATKSWKSVAYGNDTFVAVAYNSGSDAAATSQDGITWTLRTLPANAYWYSVTYGNGTFVAVARDSAIAATITFTGQTEFANVSAATSSTLSLTGLTKATDDGDRYRVVVSANNAAPVTSKTATLTVS